MNAWRADPLVWGHGPRIFEMFLEPTCPFSVKAFGKLDDLLDQAGEEHITIKVPLSKVHRSQSSDVATSLLRGRAARAAFGRAARPAGTCP